MTTRETEDREQGKTAHGQSLAQKLRWLHVACFVASCGDPNPVDGPPVDPNDVDADGVPNADDLCPESPDPDQHDEDLDGVGDVCDVCPAVSDDQADNGEMSTLGFGDRIGDACDPRPSRDGDKLARFDPFATDTSAQYSGTGWTIGADVARTVTPARWEFPRAFEGDGLFAQIHVTALEWLGPGTVEVSVNGGANSAASCTVVHGSDGDTLIARELEGATTLTDLGAIGVPFTLTAWRLINRDRVAQLRCLVDAVELVLPLVLDEIATGTIAFASSEAITDVDSLVVYTFPINPCFQGATAPHDCPTNEPDF